LEKIGVGGMGEVYLAEDLSLDRKVALKFLPDVFTGDPERMARFEREAKLLASLNHPNIAAIYGLEQADGKRFLIMEYVEGGTLQARISKGALPLDEALGVCKQIAEGLEAAHEKGVIHRDLKPANVMITGEEKVKILDFGLAKAFANEQSDLNLSNSPTLSLAATQQGIILGTAGYMSPEQARGKSVDRRADIWAFGVILYEMLTGSQLFKGETVSDTMASVLTQEPDLNKVSPKVRPLLKCCLAKDPKLRLRDIGDTISLLEFPPEIESPSQLTKTNRLAWGVAILTAFIAVASIILNLLGKPEEDFALRRYKIDYPDNVRAGGIGNFALSPDGSKLVFLGTDSNNALLWLQSLDSFDARPLPGTTLSGSGGQLFWSPDSRFIAFDAGSQLIKVDVATGSVRKICDLSGLIIGGSWNRDGVIIFYDAINNSLMRVSESGGKPSLVMKPDPDKGERLFYFPVFLPDGSHFLYFCGSNDPEIEGIYVGNLHAEPEKQIRKKVVDTAYRCLYVPNGSSDSGYLLMMVNQDIVATPFNHNNLELADNSFMLAQGVGNYFEHVFFSASNNGVLVYRGGRGLQKQFQWLGRDGTVLETVGEPGDYRTFDLSRDASQLVVGKFGSSSGGGQNLWLFDMSRKGLSKPLTFLDTENTDPRWSRDGDYIIFGSSQDIARSPFKLALPSLDLEQVFKFNGSLFSLDDISPDNEYLLYHDSQIPELWVRPLTDDKERIPIIKYPTGTLDQAQFSPDGRYIAFHSSVSGDFEVKVVPFPSTGEEWQISTEGGVQPTWRMDGRELYFVAPSGMLMAVKILPGETFAFGTPQSLFPTGLSGDISIEEYAPHPDGERFLLFRPVEENKDMPFKVILNWTSLLEQ
jgi:serine/threonine protein kinase